MPDIEVQTKTYVKQYQIVKIVIQLTELVLNKTASFVIDLEAENRDLADRLYLTLSEQEYQEWSNDDDYIVNLILNKYGFVRKTEE